MRAWQRWSASEGVVCCLLLFAVLWKGGKSLESTWIALGIATFCALAWRVRQRRWKAEQVTSRDRKIAPQDSPIHVVFLTVALLYVLWTILSYITSETATYGLDVVFRTAAYTLLCLWAARMAVPDESLVRIWIPRTIAIAAILSFVIGCVVYALQPVDRFVGSFFDARFHTDYWPNAWAEYVLLAWPMIALEAWKARSRWLSLVWLVALGAVVGGLLLSYSRGGLIAFGGQAALAIVLAVALLVRDVRYRPSAVGRILRTGAAVLLVLCVGLSVFVGMNAVRAERFSVQSVAEKATFTAAEGTSSVSERASFWGQAWMLAQQRPWVGFGPGSFRFVQTRLMDGVLATSDHPHNLFLQIAMERGMPAVLLLMVMLGWIAVVALHRLFAERRAQTTQDDAQTLLLLVAVAGVLAHVQIDYNLQFVGLGAGWWLVLGLLLRPHHPPRTESTVSFGRWRVRRWLILTEQSIAVLLVLLACMEGAYLLTSSLARHAEASGQTERALLWYARSHGELFSRDAQLSEASLHAEREEFAEARAALGTVLERNPHDARAWLMLGDIALRQEDWNDAEELLAEAYERGKYMGATYMRLYVYALRRTASHEALVTRKEEFDTLFSAYAQAIQQNAHFIALSMNPEELVQIANQLAAAYPTDAVRYRTIARKALEHAEQERQRFTGRASGLLW